MARRNLILIHRGRDYERDFDEIAARVNALAPDITVFALPSRLRVELPEAEWGHPSFTVALEENFQLPVRRGPILCSRPVDKLTQMAIFRSHGIPCPPAEEFSFGMPLDPLLYGSFVILKPGDLALTSKGQGVFLFRRKRLAVLRPQDLAPDHPLRAGRAYLVQRFVDTGPFPRHYRVQTFLGEVLYSWRQTLKQERPPLDAPDHVLEAATVASQGGDRTFELAFDAEVLALGRAVHAAFPEFPTLGVDIVRDRAAGRLQVLECNPGGNTWHMSSAMGQACRASLGGAPGLSAAEADARGRLALIGQFNAFDRAAEALVRAVTERAA